MTALRRPLMLALVLGIAAAGVACSQDTAGPTRDPVASLAVLPGGAQEVTGEIGPGALYALYLPEGWNGDLVLFAHGYTPSGPPMPADQYGGAALRDGLLALHYGVAMSSYSFGGVALKDAAVRTAQLQGLFTANFARPRRTYLVSMSLGAAVVMSMADQHPNLYDGVLPMCGIVAGVPFQFNHYFNTRVLFDYFFPGVLPGNAVTNPNGFDAAVVYAALDANPAAAYELAGMQQLRMEYSSFGELKDDIVWELTFNAADWFTNDIMAATHGRPFFDNSRTHYSGSGDDAALNAGVGRFTAHQDAVNAVAHLYTPSGRLRIPVLTLHTRADPIVPLVHETTFAELVAANRASDLLVTRIIDRAGHCNLTLPEQLGAFQDLASWVQTGVKPAS